MLAQFPTAPHYPQVDGSEWLQVGLFISASLKGRKLVGLRYTVNRRWVSEGARCKKRRCCTVAHHVRQKVGEKFNVWLEPEVRFIGASGEVSAVETIS
ncbi:hypothetical protein ACNKHM_10695 [Shigella sonnei]